jgi:hypothetical protein
MANALSRSSVVARFTATTLFAFGCSFASQSMADGQFHNRTRHLHHGWNAERVGWGWGRGSGWYAGPFFRGKSHG